MSNKVTQVYNTTPEELIKDIKQVVEDKFSELSSTLSPKEPEDWITRKQLKEMLSVSYVSIHNWCDKGIIKSYKIGAKTLFKRSEIEKVLDASRSSK